MTFLSVLDIHKLRNKGAKIGNHVLIDSMAVITNPNLLSIGDFSRISAFSFISGKICIGKFTEIGVHVILSGFDGITIGDACAISPFSYLFTNSANFENESLSLPTIPKRFKKKIESGPIALGDHVIVGAHSSVFPHAIIGTGNKFGAYSLVKGKYETWGLNISTGNKIARRLRELRSDVIMIDYERLLKEMPSS